MRREGLRVCTPRVELDHKKNPKAENALGFFCRQSAGGMINDDARRKLQPTSRTYEGMVGVAQADQESAFRRMIALGTYEIIGTCLGRLRT